ERRQRSSRATQDDGRRGDGALAGTRGRAFRGGTLAREHGGRDLRSPRHRPADAAHPRRAVRGRQRKRDVRQRARAPSLRPRRRVGRAGGRRAPLRRFHGRSCRVGGLLRSRGWRGEFM
ncbi:MAG: hypothetical protein AVDCRST_MAG58-1333, partial [uncultured Rubrobacteraceae bacterium]